MQGIKWWALVPAANQPNAGDGKRAVTRRWC